MEKVNVEIEGLTSLLMHKPVLDIGDVIKRGGKKQIVPEEVAERATYRNKKGKIFAPYTWFEGMLKNAGKNFQIAGKGKKTYSKLIGSSLAVNPEEVILDNQNYEIDARHVIINKARVMGYRPRFDKWGCDFEICFLDDSLSPAEIKPILEYGGLYVGVGAWRPEKGGRFGKFKVVSWEEKT